MRITALGSLVYSEEDILEALKLNPTANLNSVLSDDAEPHNTRIDEFCLEFDKLLSSDTFDNLSMDDHITMQNNWRMPDSYKIFPIDEWLIDQCHNDDEIVRMGEELFIYQDMDLFNLLRYCKYLVDLCRDNRIVIGVGRGSSVASFALYKIGLHKINSLEYELDIREFLK